MYEYQLHEAGNVKMSFTYICICCKLVVVHDYSIDCFFLFVCVIFICLFCFDFFGGGGEGEGVELFFYEGMLKINTS